MFKVIRKNKKECPVNFSGRVLRKLAEDKSFTIGDFKKRYSLKEKSKG